MKKDPKIFLMHILESIENIDEYTKGITKDKFLESEEKQDALIRRLEIIGEATRNISKEFRDKYPDLPWQDIADMRNKLVHEYFIIDPDIVWQVIEEDIPNLKERITEILEIIK